MRAACAPACIMNARCARKMGEKGGEGVRERWARGGDFAEYGGGVPVLAHLGSRGACALRAVIGGRGLVAVPGEDLVEDRDILGAAPPEPVAEGERGAVDDEVEDEDEAGERCC